MSVPKFFLFYVLVLLVFLVIDLLWLGFIGKGFYQKQLGHLMGEVNWSAALRSLVWILLLCNLRSYESGDFEVVACSCRMGRYPLGSLSYEQCRCFRFFYREVVVLSRFYFGK